MKLSLSILILTLCVFIGSAVFAILTKNWKLCEEIGFYMVIIGLTLIISKHSKKK